MLNKTTLIGNLGADPDIRTLAAGGQVATLSLATTRKWKDKQTGDRKEHTEWHRVIFFNRLAEIAADYLKKGSQIYVEGRLQTRKWQGQDGIDHYTTEIIGETMHMLGSKASPEQSRSSGAAPANPAPATNNTAPAASPTTQNKTYPAAPNNTAPPPPTYDQDFDDDIPF